MHQRHMSVSLICVRARICLSVYACAPLLQTEGFKNVSLGNVLAASMAAKAVTFLRSDNGDEALFKGG